MNKRRVEKMLPRAYKALREVNIAQSIAVPDAQNKNEYIVEKGYRGQISAFAASVTMGSMPAAVAFFSQKGDSDYDRDRLIKAIFIVLQDQSDINLQQCENLQQLVLQRPQDSALRTRILEAAAALKLAINLYKLVQKEDEAKNEQS